MIYWNVNFYIILFVLYVSMSKSSKLVEKSFQSKIKIWTTATLISIPIIFGNIHDVNAIKLPVDAATITRLTKEVFSSDSPGLKLARQKRTIAVKAMEDKGILQIHTDDTGNQFLSLPWFPGQKIPYKSMPLSLKLSNEFIAGALGEITKDILLHSVDTTKTRRQASLKLKLNDTIVTNTTIIIPKKLNIFENFKDLYSGFPVVLASSIPQGGIFFLVKKGSYETIITNFPLLPSFLTSMIPISLGVMTYWLFRTPAEVIKTQVQTKQCQNVKQAIEESKTKYPNGLFGLWKHYPVCLYSRLFITYIYIYIYIYIYMTI